MTTDMRKHFVLILFFLLFGLIQSQGELFDKYTPIYNQAIVDQSKSLIYSTTVDYRYNCFQKCSSMNSKCVLVSIVQNDCKLYSIVNFTNFRSAAAITLFEKKIDNYLASINAFLTNHWPFNNNLNDAIASGSLYGGASYSFTTDRLNRPSSAIYFANGYLIAPARSYFKGDLTVSAWVKVHSFTGWARLIDFATSGTVADAVFLAVSGGLTGQPCSEIYNNGISYGQRWSPIVMKILKWQHLAMTLNGNTFTIYLDAVPVLVSNANSPREITRPNAYIGRSNWGDAYANFEIDDLKIFNRSLTNAELKKVLNSYL